MRIVDISRTLQPDTAVWPGDTPFQVARTLERRLGATVNLTTLTLSAHTGTHVDAPLHFTDDGPAVDALDLAVFWGPAQVVSVSKPSGGLVSADFAAVDLSRAPRLLVRSAASAVDPRLFPAAYPFPSPELAAHLAAFGIVLYGSDGPSMDAEDSKSLAGHHALHRHGIAILEWLDLSAVADGLYELVALPLKVGGGDGSPVRAALRPLAS
jgi:arylformamidase